MIKMIKSLWWRLTGKCKKCGSKLKITYYPLPSNEEDSFCTRKWNTCTQCKYEYSGGVTNCREYL